MNATQKNSRLMGMNEGGFTSGDAEIHILGSGAAADCIIIAGYVAASKQLFLVHATRQTNLVQVHTYIGTLGVEASFYLSSTSIKDQSTSSLLAKARDQFPKAKEFDSGSLAIDAQSGEVADDINLGEFGKPAWMLALSEGGPRKKLSAEEGQKYKVVEIPSFKQKEGQKAHEDGKSSDVVGLTVEYFDPQMEKAAKAKPVQMGHRRTGSSGALKINN